MIWFILATIAICVVYALLDTSDRRRYNLRMQEMKTQEARELRMAAQVFAQNNETQK